MRAWLARAAELIAVARRAAAEASRRHSQRRRMAGLRRSRVPARPRSVAAGDVGAGRGRPGTGSNAHPSPPTAVGARPRRSSPPAPHAPRPPHRSGEAHTVAASIGAAPLRRELELLAQRARLDLIPADHRSTDQADPLEHLLGLTPREAEVLELVARGYTNREIAAALFISVKTASVHVSHILSKLGATTRTDAATIAHRFAPPPGSVPQPHPARHRVGPSFQALWRRWPRPHPAEALGTPDDMARRSYMASTLGMISSFRRLRSSSVFATGTSWNGGQRSGIVSPASL